MDQSGRDLLAPGRRERRLALWLALGVWAAAGVFFVVPTLPVIGRLAGYIALANLICAAFGATISCGLGQLALGSWRFPLAGRVGLSALAVILGAGLMVTLDLRVVLPVTQLVFPADAEGVARMASHTLFDFFYYLWVLAFHATIVLLLEANRTAEEGRRRLAEADAAAKSAQLAALRLQLNPHFLFNTLNALSSLVVTGRSAQAELVIERLSTFLRSTLSAHWRDQICLDEELCALEAYLEIEAVRFADRFRFEFDAPPEVAQASVPSLILQPLAENAIKYAVAPASSPVTLTVQARHEGGELVIRVTDDGCSAGSAASQPGVGIGLRNIAGRLNALYGQAGRLDCSTTPEGFSAVLRMPFLSPSSAECIQSKATASHR